MRTHKRSDMPVRKPFRPELEGMEARNLLSGTIAPSGALVLGPQAETASVQTVSSRIATDRSLAAARSQATEAALEGFAQTLYGSNPPTPRELNRETFKATFIANYTVGPPRFSDRASTIDIVTPGVKAGSNQFLKARAQMVLFPPANPDATPNYGDPYANQVTGQTTFFTENFFQTGSILILDLNGSAGSEVNGFPTQMTWKFDASSGGVYTAPVGFTQGLGTVELRWIPDAHPLPGTLGSGQVVATFLGLINDSQILSGIAKIYS